MREGICEGRGKRVGFLYEHECSNETEHTRMSAGICFFHATLLDQAGTVFRLLNAALLLW